MFVQKILEKIKKFSFKFSLTFSQGKVTVLKMKNYVDARVKLANTQLNKLKSATNNKTGATLRIIKKTFQDEKLPAEVLGE